MINRLRFSAWADGDGCKGFKRDGGIVASAKTRDNYFESTIWMGYMFRRLECATMEKSVRGAFGGPMREDDRSEFYFSQWLRREFDVVGVAEVTATSEEIEVVRTISNEGKVKPLLEDRMVDVGGGCIAEELRDRCLVETALKW